MSLSQMKAGQTCVVKAMHLPFKTQERLTTLGLMEEVPVTVLNAKHQGVLIVKFRGTRYALGRNITSQIEVEPV